MIDRLRLLAPGDAHHPGQPAVVLLDDRNYEAELFASIAREVDSGPGVECVPSDTGPAFRVRHPEALATDRQIDAHVLFFAATDTDVRTLAPVARRCRGATFLVHHDQDESAARALEAEGFDFEPNRPGNCLAHADAALLASDWSVPRREFIRRCRAMHIPTLCLQEAVNVDFDGPPFRMRWADAVCVSGPHALQYLHRDLSFLTGNPRFDGYAEAPPPARPRVLINCNFILGLGGERGPAWMKVVLEVVNELNLDYRISKHPRDDTDLAGIDNVLPSGAYKVADQLAACSVLISRDSSLPYEAMLMGRRVVYFDPFHEKERTLREDESGWVRKTDSKESLRDALREALDASHPPQYASPPYDPYEFIFTQRGAGSTQRVVLALQTLRRFPEQHRTADARVDRGARAAIREHIELRLRPRLRRIGPLRRAWRAARRMSGRT